LLTAFRQEAKDDTTVPHVYASYRLLMGLMGKLKEDREAASLETFRFEDYSPEKMNEALKRLLDESTRSLASL
jgi:hypothetical protein